MALTPEQIQAKLDAVRGWLLIDGQIQKTFSFPDFLKAMDFVNQLGAIAEHEDHHPDMRIRYNKVTIALSTHDEDGVTDKDFKMAKASDQLAVELL